MVNDLIFNPTVSQAYNVGTFIVDLGYDLQNMSIKLAGSLSKSYRATSDDFDPVIDYLSHDSIRKRYQSLEPDARLTVELKQYLAGSEYEVGMKGISNFVRDLDYVHSVIHAKISSVVGQQLANANTWYMESSWKRAGLLHIELFRTNEVGAYYNVVRKEPKTDHFVVTKDMELSVITKQILIQPDVLPVGSMVYSGDYLDIPNDYAQRLEEIQRTYGYAAPKGFHRVADWVNDWPFNADSQPLIPVVLVKEASDV